MALGRSSPSGWQQQLDERGTVDVLRHGVDDHGMGQGPQDEPEKEQLSKIIDVLNERFGLQLTIADQLFFDQMEATWLTDDQLVAQARANPIENFRLVFADAFMKGIVGRMDDNSVANLTGIDIQYPATFVISGTVTAPDGTPVAGIQVSDPTSRPVP